MSEITHKPNKADQWASHIWRWRESNLSQQEYCKQAGIGYAAFVYWRGKLSKDSKTSNSKFVSVTVEPKKSTPNEVPKSIQIKLITGHVVYIPTTLPIDDMTALINALGNPHA